MHKAIAFLLIAVAGVPAAHAVTDADRTDAYHEFRSLFDVQNYKAALPVAQRLVALTEEQYGADSRELVNPLSNLGTTNYRLGNHQAAEESYLRSLKILEATAGPADVQLLRPLHGLGATYFAAHEFEDASVTLKRAVDLSRNVNGLFNVDQLAILEPLIQTHVELGRYEEADQEHQYAFRVAENAYGRTDLRLLQPLDRYARWFEFIGRYTAARALHARALSIAEKGAGHGTALAVEPLQGIARSYRLEYVNGGEDEATAMSPSSLQDSLGQRVNADGERALRMALETLDKQQPVDHVERGDTLIELGDWYLCSGATTKALDTYVLASKEISMGAAAQDPLSAPRQLAYRPPSTSAARSHLSPDEAQEQPVQISFTVTREGKTVDIVKVAGEVSDSIERSVVSAVRKARYSPRIENGQAVDTKGVTLIERIMVKKNPKDS